MIRIFSGLALAALLMGSVAAQDTVRDHPVSDFSHLDAGGNFSLRFEPSGTATVRLEGDLDDIENIDVEMRGNRLEIRQRRGIRTWFRRSSNLDVRVYVGGPAVGSFAFSRGINAGVSGLQPDDLTINVSTGANADFAGQCGQVRINTSTGARLDAGELNCRSVTANASTGSDMIITAETALHARASTGAIISSLTRPAELETRASTGGDVRIGSRR